MTQQFHPRWIEFYQRTEKQVREYSQHTIHLGKKVEAMKISIHWQMEQQEVVCPYNGILVSQKKEWSPDAHDPCWKSDERSRSQKLCMIPLIGNIQDRHIRRDRKQTGGCRRLGVDRHLSGWLMDMRFSLGLMKTSELGRWKHNIVTIWNATGTLWVY